MSNKLSSLVSFSTNALAYWRTTTTDTTLNPGDLILCDTTAGSLTLTLPASPTIGASVTLKDEYGTWSTSPVNINPNGQKVFSSTSNAAITNAGIMLIFLGPTIGWQPYSSDTVIGASLRAASSAASARSTLGLGSISTQASSSIQIIGGSIDNVTIGATTPAISGNFTSLTTTTQPVTDNSQNAATTAFVYNLLGGNWQNISATYAMGAAQYPANIFADTTSAPFTITLPSSPLEGSKIVIADPKKVWGTNNLTINPNGQNLSGDTTNLVCNASGYVLTFIFKTGVGWSVFGTVFQ